MAGAPARSARLRRWADQSQNWPDRSHGSAAGHALAPGHRIGRPDEDAAAACPCPYPTSLLCRAAILFRRTRHQSWLRLRYDRRQGTLAAPQDEVLEIVQVGVGAG